MTVISGIEIDDINYKLNDIKQAIVNNDKIEDKLHVIVVISNPCLYARRYILLKEFINRMEQDDSDIIIYIVELVYKKQRFIVTDKKNKRHLQLQTETPIWHKENMINLGVKYLLPSNWKAFGWIDADLDFDSGSWASDALKILNGSKDIIQLWSHCIDMDMKENAMKIFSSFGFQFCKGIEYKQGINFFHPGYAWAITRKAYEKIGGLFEYGILGSGDHIMALSLIKNGLKAININSSDDYKEHVKEYENKIKNLRLGYVPGIIRHYYHGSKKNRHYDTRWKILVDNNYEPSKHVTHKNGILVPTKECPKEIIIQIFDYFKSRNEDDCYKNEIVDNTIFKKIRSLSDEEDYDDDGDVIDGEFVDNDVDEDEDEDIDNDDDVDEDNDYDVDNDDDIETLYKYKILSCVIL